MNKGMKLNNDYPTFIIDHEMDIAFVYCNDIIIMVRGKIIDPVQSEFIQNIGQVIDGY